MRKIFLILFSLLLLSSGFCQNTQDLIAVELDELESETGFTEDEAQPFTPDELPQLENEDKTSEEETSTTKKIEHQPLPGIPEEILQRPDVDKFR